MIGRQFIPKAGTNRRLAESEVSTSYPGVVQQRIAIRANRMNACFGKLWILVSVRKGRTASAKCVRAAQCCSARTLKNCTWLINCYRTLSLIKTRRPDKFKYTSAIAFFWYKLTLIRATAVFKCDKPKNLPSDSSACVFCAFFHLKSFEFSKFLNYT